KQDFVEEVLKITHNHGVDLILDFIGASYWEKNLASIKVDGRWVLIGVLGGSIIDSVNLRDLMMKRIQLTGTLLTPRSDDYKAKLTKEFISNTYKLFENEQLKPIIDHIFRSEEHTSELQSRFDLVCGL